jgi:Domain of unknown function (DUF4336)
MALRESAEQLWVVEVPLRFLGLQLGRRMAVIRLASGELLVHSPAPLTDQLRQELDRLGPVRYVVPASALHGHLFMEEYRDAYPAVELFAAPGLERRRKDLTFAGELGDEPDPRWSADLDQAVLQGHRLFPEVAFHHKPSRTLILGDACWNVTPQLSLGARLWAGLRTRVGPTPGFRLMIRDKDAARASVERILSWDFDRMLPGHGEIVDTGAHEAFRRAYAWLG